eukprot:CAMPEP_0113857946 /NCGR_PEP_ID=MMETSP0372-20130328/10764_1 /TAXON_ID=340204 /ORGANISM="Lankesteria abbotti" /LENGTH=143 /DNA_ID=CAMNT_0000834495 /DNA_START=51 /DNA_END=482 /DNA_ORIENTATION=- /assembly_acc=CAM_ASM_000359
MAEKQKGSCKWFNSTKGFGFITTETGDDYFVHQSDIHAKGFRSLAEGEQVEFVVQHDQSGRQKAVEVTGPQGAYVKGDDRMPRNDFGAGGGGASGYGGGGRRDYGGYGAGGGANYGGYGATGGGSYRGGGGGGQYRQGGAYSG